MTDVLKICGVALVCIVCAVILRHFKGEMALLVRIGGAVLIFSAVAFGLGLLFDGLWETLDRDALEPYVSVLFKALGIALTAKICSDICRDCGEVTVAGGVEMGGKLSILALCIPLIDELMDYAAEFLRLG